MKRIIMTIICLIIFYEIGYSFEVDGLKSGMSMIDVKLILEKYSYESIQVLEDQIIAQRKTGGIYHSMIVANFCNNKLCLVQKDLKPRFDYFVQLVADKTRELGKPLDVRSNPTDVASNIISNSITFIWKDGNSFISVTYTEFSSNNQLNIVYETYNDCYKIPY